MKKFYIIDNAFITKYTHSHFETLALINNLKYFEYEPCVIVTKTCKLTTDFLEYRRFFSFHFDKVLWRDNGWSNIEPYAIYFAKEFLSAIKNVGPSDIVFLPNVCADELFGIEIALKNNNLNQRIHIRVGTFPVPAESVEKWLGILAKLDKFSNVRLHVFNPLVAELMRTRGIRCFESGHVQDLPYFLEGSIDKKYDFVYLGVAADAKGFPFLLESIRAMGNIGIKPRFLIQHSGVNIDDNVKKILSNVDWISDYVDDKTWFSHLLSARYLVAFYDLDIYNYSTSNQIPQALALGVGVIASPMNYLKGIYGNEIFEDLTTKDRTLPSLTKKIIQKYSEKKYNYLHFEAGEISKKIMSPILCIRNILHDKELNN